MLSRLVALVIATVGLACHPGGSDSSEPSARFAYTRVASGRIIGFRVDPAGELAPLATVGVQGQAAFRRFTTHASGRFLYGLPESRFFGSGVLDAFAVDSATGALARVPGFPRTHPTANGCVLSPDGRFLYVANAPDDWSPGPVLSGFAVDAATGALRELALAVPVAPFAAGPMIHPSGRFLYVSVSTGGPLRTLVMNIDQGSGALSLRNEQDSVFGEFDPSGRFLYASLSRSTIAPPTVHSVNATDGSVSAGRSALVKGPQPWTFVFDPTGPHVFGILDEGRHTVSVSTYRIGEDGRLREHSERVRLDVPGCANLSADPSGRFLFVAASCTQLEVLHGGISGDPTELTMLAILPSRQQFVLSPRPPTIVELGGGPLALIGRAP